VVDQVSRYQTRRQLLKTAIGGAAGIVLGGPLLRLTDAHAQAGPASGGTQKLADDLFVVSVPREANVVAQTSSDGVLLVDGASVAGSDALMKALSGLPGGGHVHTLFNTHWHPEQTGLNERLGKTGTTIIAHENTRLWLTQNITWPWDGRQFKKLPKVAQLNKTFYDTGKLASGVRYGYLPDAAHTDGDLYVHFPSQNVLVVGDAVYGQGWPVVDYWTGGWIGGIAGGLQRLQTLADANTRIVPARGPILGLAEIKAQGEMYSTLYDRLSQLLNRGRGPSEAVAAGIAKEFETKMGNSDEFVRRAFESLWAYLSPDA
jgi:glyoxylase-like metal-dependent hydrolase (beta-lactamase superfamily II)